MKQSYLWIILLVVMFMSNPTRETHITTMQSELKNTSILFSLASPLVELVHYQDFYVFSITHYEDEVFSVGLFGKVLTRPTQNSSYSKK